MDDKIQNYDLTNLLIVGDSHMEMINILFKKGKLWDFLVLTERVKVPH